MAKERVEDRSDEFLAPAIFARRETVGSGVGIIAELAVDRRIERESGVENPLWNESLAPHERFHFAFLEVTEVADVNLERTHPTGRKRKQNELPGRCGHAREQTLPILDMLENLE